MINNEIKLGDVVVWDFVFDVAEQEGVVVALNGDRVQVEYKGYQGKVYRDWMDTESVMLESEYDMKYSF